MRARFFLPIFLYLFICSLTIAYATETNSSLEMDEFIKSHPYPCPDKTTKSETSACLLDAILEYMSQGETTHSKKLGLYDFQQLVQAVALYGSTKQKETLLAEFDKHAPNLRDLEKSDQHVSPSERRALIHPEKILLLLSLNRKQEAINFTRNMSDEGVDLYNSGSPQMWGLQFLVNANKLDDAIDFFKKTEHIYFLNISETTGIRLTHPSSRLFGALLAQDRWDDAVRLKNSVDKKGIYFSDLKEDKYEEYFTVYEDYKSSPNKMAFAQAYLAPFPLPEAKKRTQAKKNALRAISDGDQKKIEKAFGELKESFGNRQKEDDFISQIMIASISDISTAKGKNFLWDFFVRSQLLLGSPPPFIFKNKVFPRPPYSPADFQLAGELLRNYFDLHRESFSTKDFLRAKLTAELEK